MSRNARGNFDPARVVDRGFSPRAIFGRIPSLASLVGAARRGAARREKRTFVATLIYEAGNRANPGLRPSGPLMPRGPPFVFLAAETRLNG